MNASKIMRNTILSVLCLATTAAARADSQPQFSGQQHSHLHVSVSARQYGDWINVYATVRDYGDSLRMPMLKVSRYRPTASTEYRRGYYLYKVYATLHGRDVCVKVKKYKHHCRVAYGSATACVRMTKYHVTVYHPLTGRRVSSRTFTDRAAAYRWYGAERQRWYLIVYKGFSKKPYKEYRGSKTYCERSANSMNRNLLDGKQGKALAPRVAMRTIQS